MVFLPSQPFCIREEQLALLQQRHRSFFIERLHQFFIEDELLSDVTASTLTYETVESVVALAESAGVTSELGIAKFGILIILFGQNFEGVSDREVYTHLQRDEGEAADPDWVNRIFEYITETLLEEQEIAYAR